MKTSITLDRKNYLYSVLGVSNILKIDEPIAWLQINRSNFAKSLEKLFDIIHSGIIRQEANVNLLRTVVTHIAWEYKCSEINLLNSVT